MKIGNQDPQESDSDSDAWMHPLDRQFIRWFRRVIAPHLGLRYAAVALPGFAVAWVLERDWLLLFGKGAEFTGALGALVYILGVSVGNLAPFRK